MSASDKCFKCMEEGKLVSLHSPVSEAKGDPGSPRTLSSGSTFTPHSHCLSSVLNGKRPAIFSVPFPRFPQILAGRYFSLNVLLMSWQVDVKRSIRALSKRLRDAFFPGKAEKTKTPSETIIRKCKLIPRVPLCQSKMIRADNG